MAKAPKSSKAAKSQTSASPKAKAARKSPAAKKPQKAATPEPSLQSTIHNDYHVFFGDEAGLQILEQHLPLIDAVIAIGRVEVTSASISEGKVSIHTVLPEHPLPYSIMPGIILTIDANDHSLWFDHHSIGPALPDIIDDAAFALLEGVKGDGAAGRRPDWYEVAGRVVDDLAIKHAHRIA